MSSTSRPEVEESCYNLKTYGGCNGANSRDRGVQGNPGSPGLSDTERQKWTRLVSIDRTSFIPLHAQLKTALRRKILDGSLVPTAALPSESALCRTYGVSRITVRRALAGLEAEGLVRRAAGRGTYVAAESERLGPSLGFLFGGLSEKTFGYRNEAAFGDMIAGAAEAAAGRNAQILPMPLDEENLEMALATPAITRLDGLLVHLTRVFTEPMLRALDESGPYVVIKRRLASGRASSVFCNDMSGAAAVTQHLVDQGHRRIALILGPAEIGVWEDRRSGFLNTLAQLGSDAQPGIVRQVGYPMDEAGREVTLGMLRSPDPPTAVFAGNDYIAVGVYRAIRDLGGEPGRDLAVAGYGVNPFATMMHPALTTLGTSGWSFGAEATNLLLDVIEGKVQSPAQRELPWHLEIRQSSSRSPGSLVSQSLSNKERPVALPG